MIVTGVKAVFTAKEQDFMKSTIGIVLSETKDYSTDELLDMHQLILDELPCEYDDDGSPKESAQLFESIVDKFFDHFKI